MTKLRIAVTGRQGQVVTSLIERAGARAAILPLGRPDLDLADPTSVQRALDALSCDIIVNAAAHTAVDKAEDEHAAAFAINGGGAGAVAEAAARKGVPLIHISTDYVFDGASTRPYAETDPTGPTGVYGHSKLDGEQRVAAATPDHAILRTAWVYSPFGANFVKTMLRLGETRSEVGVVADQVGNPTSALDIADGVLAVADRLVRDPSPTLRGTFHLAGTGSASWADLAEAVFAEAERHGRAPVQVRRITTADYPTRARRPANSQLDTSKLALTHAIELPSWRVSVAETVKRLLGKA